LFENIALFYCENKVSYAIDKDGKKFIVEINLIEIEKELDNSTFFRANRQFIINVNYIRGFRVYEKVKLKLNLVSEELNAKYCIIISQERSSIFRKWICAA
jgi:DNA-binding LytR/AlgR family response regulator